MKKYNNHTLKEFVSSLSAKTPVPGGGAAAALVAALGVALLSMVANYTKGKLANKKKEFCVSRILRDSQKIYKRLLILVDLDADAYLGVVRAKKATDKQKKKALQHAGSVPREVCRLCYQAIQLTPFLTKYGNKNLLSDVQIAVELLLAAFNSSMINIKINK